MNNFILVFIIVFLISCGPDDSDSDEKNNSLKLDCDETTLIFVIDGYNDDEELPCTTKVIVDW